MKNANVLIPLTKEMVVQLKEQRERTSLGPQALLKGRDDIPEGLNHAAVTHWRGTK